MKKKLLALLLTLCLVLGLFPIGVSAAPRRVNDTEFHIMDMDKITKVVRNWCPGQEQDEIKIQKIFVHSNSDVVDGGATNVYMPDYGAWKVLNWSDDHAFGISDNVTAITIIAQVGQNEHKIEVGIDSEQLTHDIKDYITQINLNVKLTYQPNGGTGEPVVQDFVEHDAINVGKGVTFTKENAVLLGFSEKQNGLITSSEEEAAAGIINADTYRIDQDTTLYAVWAEDKDGDTTPDYREPKHTVTYTDGVDNETIFEDVIYRDLLDGVATPAFNKDGEDPTRTGYKFTGWDPEVAETVTDDVTYKALWDVDSNGDGIADKDQVFIKYEAGENGALADGAESTKVYDVNAEETYPFEAPAVVPNPGYQMKNWQLPDGLDFSFTSGDVVLTGAEAGKTYTLTAQFEKDENQTKALSCTINYYVDGVFKENQTKEATVWVGDPDTLTVTDEVIKDFEGCIFNFASPRLPADVPNNGLIEVYYNSDSNKDGIADMNQIHVTFVIDEGMGTYEGNTDWWWTCKDTSAKTFPLNTPVVTAKEGFEFTGWACNDGATVTEDNGTYYLTQYTLGRAYTLTAQFEKTEPAPEMVRPIFVYKDGDTTVGNFQGLVMEKGVHNFSEILETLEENAPEGYKVSISGDFYADQGREVEVAVEHDDPDAGKTLRIFWAIDNPEAAAWDDGTSESYTQTIAWAERNEFQPMPKVTVAEGYKLAGWSVSGTEGQNWNAETATFSLGDALIVMDNDGGYVSITANIVSDEPEDPDAGKTLKIYWAIDNPDAASWELFNNSSWTETIAWSDSGNTFVMPEVDVEEGYHLAGWSVSGTRGEYWDADTQTFDLDGLIVEDDEGGYVSITANIVKDVPAAYTVTLVNEGRNAYGEGVYKAGDTVTIYAGTKVGYAFDRWTSGDVRLSRPYNKKITFTMPAHDVVVKATWDRTGSILPSLPDVSDDATPNWLNLDDHDAYIQGYPDGRVKPQNNITRAEVATIFYRLLTDDARDYYYSTDSGFSDVKPGDWYNTAVATMVQAGILNGYSDGTFKPNASITRAEFATIAARFLSNPYSTKDRFYDTEGHWAEVYINRAAEIGWIGGYPDGSFKPDQYITRAEAVTLVNNVLGREPHADYMLDDMIRWPDNPKSAWYYEDIQEATNSHDYRWNSGKSYEIWTKLLETR